jgi:hypothetical protein
VSDQPPKLPAWPPPPQGPPPPLWKRVLGILLTIAGGLVVGGGALLFLFAGCVSMVDTKSRPLMGQSAFIVIVGGIVVWAGVAVMRRR